MECPLCLSKQVLLIKFHTQAERYFHCEACDLRFLNPKYYLSVDEERKRYELHQNDANDPDYRNFVRPLFELISQRLPQSANGLDFGAGRGSALVQMLKEKGFEMDIYDPFFWPHKEVLKRKFDFIVLTEVAEHFYHPHQEFQTLKTLLKEGGTLGIMTLLYHPAISFEDWYYRKDPTHVCFYSAQTFSWIAENMGLKNINIHNDRVITLET